jgi:NAD-dependent dihydropyrimidine dehydrogenase PreA subunit
MPMAADPRPSSTSAITAAPGRARLVAVVEENCTGCNACVDYCLVDCIEPTATTNDQWPMDPVRIREDECIGCSLCAKVCEQVAVNAIRLLPLESDV